MSLFVCDECGSVDNTALTRYWLRNWDDEAMEGKALNGRALCSACDPEIGKWHDRFDREPWDGKRQVINGHERVGGSSSMSEQEVVEDLRRQVAAYDDGTAGTPGAVAAWLRSLADALEALDG